MDVAEDAYQRFLTGDNTGLTEIIRTYKDGLILYLRGFTDDIYQAEELAEDTFVKLVIKRPVFHKRCSFKTWLYAIGRNVAVDYARRQSRHREVTYDNCPELIDDEANLEYTYIREERAIILHRAMQKLKPEYRQVLWLSYFEDFSNGEIGRIMKRSTHSVETLVWRAKHALKEQLDKEGFVYEEL